MPTPHPCPDGLNARRPAAGTVLKPGDFQGTIPYASLEALQHCLDGDGSFDLHRSDVYSAGVTLFQLLVGTLPVDPAVPRGPAMYAVAAHELAILQSVLTRRIPKFRRSPRPCTC